MYLGPNPYPLNIPPNTIPVTSLDAPTQTKINQAVQRPGDTMTGPLTVPGETNSASLNQNGPIYMGAQNATYAWPIFYGGSATGPLMAYNITTKVTYFTNAANSKTIFSWDDNGNTSIAGTLGVTGLLTANAGLAVPAGGIVGTNFDANGANLRLIYGNYGFMVHMDASAVYFMQTASGNQNGQWNTYRPIYWNLATGGLSLDGTGAGTVLGGPVNINGITQIQATSGQFSPGMMLNANGYAPFIRSNNASGGQMEWVNNGNTAVNMTLTDAGALWTRAGHTIAAGGLTVNGTLNANNNITATGQIAGAADVSANGAMHCAGGLFAVGNGGASVYGQGTYINWNESNGVGETDFVNNRGGGAGGFVFRSVNQNNTTQYFSNSIDGNGQFIINGGTSHTISGGFGFLNTSGAGTGSNNTTGAGLYIPSQAAIVNQCWAISDRRIKSHIVPIDTEYAYRFVQNVTPMQFFKNGDTEHLVRGFIAQDVGKQSTSGTEMLTAAPREGLMYEIDDDGYESPKDMQLAIDYEQIIAIQAAVIRDLIRRVEALESR